MPVRFLSDAQREQLSGFPAELEPESLDRFFTLSGPDLAEVRRRHRDENRLGWSLQLCGDSFYICLDLPGINPGSIDLTVEQNVLTVRADRAPVQADGAQMIVAERPYGTSPARSSSARPSTPSTSPPTTPPACSP